VVPPSGGVDVEVQVGTTVLYTDYRWSNIQGTNCWSGPPQDTGPIATPAPQGGPISTPAPLDSGPIATPSPQGGPSSTPAPQGVTPNSTPAPQGSTPKTTPAPAAAPTTDTAEGGSWFCFSGHTTVKVDGKGLTRMDELKIGDLAMTSTGKFSKIYSFIHYAPETQALFLQIQMNDNGYPLEITADHLIYVYDGIRKNNATILRAGDVKVGDSLLSENGTAARVISVRTVKRQGVFAPATEHGDIVVNGVIASSYVALASFQKMRVSFEVQTWMQHVALGPYRHYCSLVGGCESETYDEETGFSSAVTMWVPVTSALDWVLSVDCTSLLASVVGFYLFMWKWNDLCGKSDIVGEV